MADKSKYSWYWGFQLIISFATTAINSFVVATFIRHRGRIFRKNNNKILLSLACADSFVGVFSATHAILLLAGERRLYYKTFGNLPLFGSMFVSILSMSLLTGDRLVAVKRPLQHQSIVTKKRLKIAICCIWGFPLLLTIQQYVLFFSAPKSMELDIRGTFLIVWFFVGASFLGISNGFLYGIVREQFKKLIEHENTFVVQRCQSEEMCEEISLKDKSRSLIRPRISRVIDKKKLRKSDLQASKECLYIVVVFIMCWLPLSIYRFAYSLGEGFEKVHLRRSFLIFALSSSLINPWIYFFKKKQFRRYISSKDGNGKRSSGILWMYSMMLSTTTTSLFDFKVMDWAFQNAVESLQAELFKNTVESEGSVSQRKYLIWLADPLHESHTNN